MLLPRLPLSRPARSLSPPSRPAASRPRHASPCLAAASLRFASPRPVPSRPISPRLASSRLTSPRLASSRLACACQLATRRQTHPGFKLRSHANAAARLLRLLGPRLSFTHANPTPRPRPPVPTLPPPAVPASSWRLLSRLRSSVSFFVAALSRGNFATISLRSLFSSRPGARARAAPRSSSRCGEDLMSFGRKTFFNSATWWVTCIIERRCIKENTLITINDHGRRRSVLHEREPVNG